MTRMHCELLQISKDFFPSTFRRAPRLADPVNPFTLLRKTRRSSCTLVSSSHAHHFTENSYRFTDRTLRMPQPRQNIYKDISDGTITTDKIHKLLHERALWAEDCRTRRRFSERITLKTIVMKTTMTSRQKHRHQDQERQQVAATKHPSPQQTGLCSITPGE